MNAHMHTKIHLQISARIACVCEHSLFFNFFFNFTRIISLFCFFPSHYFRSLFSVHFCCSPLFWLKFLQFFRLVFFSISYFRHEKFDECTLLPDILCDCFVRFFSGHSLTYLVGFDIGIGPSKNEIDVVRSHSIII